MTDYKKRILEALGVSSDEQYVDTKAKFIIEDLLPLLHQVEAETDRNSRLDELKKLPTKTVYAQEWVDPEIRIPVKRNIDVIDMEDVQRRLDVLAHREES